MARFSLRIPKNEQGQAIVIVALFLSLVFLALAALAIDGTIIYLRRRQLQNMADAAALAAATQLSQNKDVPAAYALAISTLTSNGAQVEWYSTSSTPNPPTTNVGTGVNLTSGIEITNTCEVRVALHWSGIGTYLAQFAGWEELEVGANAHAGCNKAGGLQPIAVKRFGDDYDTSLNHVNIHNPTTTYCDTCSTQFSLASQGHGEAYDFLRPETSDIITTWPTGTLMYQPPSPHAELASSAPGREYFILGANVGPNVGVTSYVGLVNLDIRHISADPTEWYNGVNSGTGSNTLKDRAEYYIRRGYCCDIPTPGEQVAMYNGGSTAFAAQAFRETYAIGDVVAVIVYNGHVLSSPTLRLTGETPHFKATFPTTATIASSVLTYTFQLQGLNGFQSATTGMAMSVEGLDGFADWSFSNPSPRIGYVAGDNPATVYLNITPRTAMVSGVTEVITGTRMFYVLAYDSNATLGTKIRRYWAGVVSVGTPTSTWAPAVTARPTNSDDNFPLVSANRGDSTVSFNLELDQWGNVNNRDITVSVGTMPAGQGSCADPGSPTPCFSWGNPQPPWTETNVNNRSPQPDQELNIKLQIADVEALVRAEPYVIPLTVSSPGLPSQTFNLYVVVKNPGTDPNDYVEILGYAALQVMGYYNSTNPVGPGQPANSVRGRIVSELMTSPDDLKYGLRARLIPWE